MTPPPPAEGKGTDPPYVGLRSLNKSGSGNCWADFDFEVETGSAQGTPDEEVEFFFLGSSAAF